MKLWDTDLLIRVTGFGIGFILVTFVVALGATNTGNNGLYLLLSLLFGILVVSGVLSRRNVAGLHASLEGPEELFAGEAARFRLTLRNAQPRQRTGILVRVDGREAPLLFPTVGPFSENERGIDLVFPKRGLPRIESLTIYSLHPIGLFRKGRRHPARVDRLVFPSPALLSLPEPDRTRAANEGARAERRGRGAGIRNLREALPGDDPRDIHWPQTARQGSPIVRERDSEEARSAIVVLEGGPGAFEEAVSEATGAVLQLLSRGDRVGLVAGAFVLSPGSGPHHRRALLGALALVQPSGTDPRPPLPSDAALYVIRPRGPVGVGR